MIRSHRLPLVAFAATALAAAAVAQQVPPPQVPGQGRPGVARGQQPIESVEQLRGGRHVDVLRQEELPGFDFSGLDWSRDTLLLVDGEPITQQDLRRGLCLLAGGNKIEQFISKVLSERMEARLREEGLDPSSWQVTQEDLEKKYEEQRPYAAQSMGMTEDEYDQYIEENIGKEEFLELQRSQSTFERLFMPKPPAGFLAAQNEVFQVMLKAWNEEKAQVEAANAQEKINAAKEGREPQIQPIPPAPLPEADLGFLPALLDEVLEPDWAQMVREFYARGMEVPAVMRGGVANTIRDRLLRDTPVRFWEELPAAEADGVLFRLGDATVTVAQVYGLIEPRLNDAMRSLALREVLMLRGADRALAQVGYLPTQEQAEQRYQDMAAQYENSILPLPHAVMLRGFQSVHHYKRYWRRKGAYQAYLAETVDEARLREHFDQSGRLFFEQGSLYGQVLFVPGEDREATLQTARAALAEVDAGADFAEVARRVGAWPGVPDSADGTVGGLVRNRLRSLLEESEYTTFATGYSMADEAFYHGREGSVLGPVFHDWGRTLGGALALRVSHFTSSGRRQPFEQARETVLEDLADLTFPRFALEALLAAEITEPPVPAP